MPPYIPITEVRDFTAFLVKKMVLVILKKGGKAASVLINTNIDSMIEGKNEDELYEMLKFACVGGCMEAIKKLVGNVKNINGTENEEYTPLGVAYKVKNKEVMKYLIIEKGANFAGTSDKINYSEFYALYEEIKLEEEKNHDNVKEEQNKSNKVLSNTKNVSRKQLPKKKSKMLSKDIERIRPGRRKNRTYGKNTGYTLGEVVNTSISNSLLKECKNNESDSKILSLLETGCDVNITDEDGKTPLIMACEKKNATIIKELIRRGANENIRDNVGMTAGEIVAKSGDNLLMSIYFDALDKRKCVYTRNI